MKKRLLFVCITLPPFIIIMFYNKIILLFHIFILSVSLLITWEIFHMAKIHRQKNLRTIVTTMFFMIIAYIITVCGLPISKGDITPLYKIDLYHQPSMELGLIMVFALIATLFAINMFKVDTSTFEERGRAILTALFTFIYVGLGFWHITLMRLMPSGKYYILFIYLCAWLSDTGGYIVGRRFGKHKMYNSASANKSYEGFFGMFLFTIPMAFIFDYLSKNGFTARALGLNIMDYSLSKTIGLAFIFTITGFLGDMGESLIKRMYDTKDSSELFPGHGGVFDIFDSIVLTAPIAYYIFIFT